MMPKRIFPSFPLAPPMVPTDDIELNALIECHGGWPVVLNPDNELPSSLLSELEAKGYSPDELMTWRMIEGAEGREKILLRSACLGCLLASKDASDFTRPFHEAIFWDLAAERKAYGITYDEIRAAAEKVGFYILSD